METTFSKWKLLCIYILLNNWEKKMWGKPVRFHCWKPARTDFSSLILKYQQNELQAQLQYNSGTKSMWGKKNKNTIILKFKKKFTEITEKMVWFFFFLKSNVWKMVETSQRNPIRTKCTCLGCWYLHIYTRLIVVLYNRMIRWRSGGFRSAVCGNVKPTVFIKLIVLLMLSWTPTFILLTNSLCIKADTRIIRSSRQPRFL